MVKEKGLSFTLAFVHAVCKCANEVEALRYRFLDEKIVLYDRIDTAFTYLNKDTGLFKVVNVPFVEDLEEYVRIAGKTAEEQKEYFTGPLGNDVFQCSPMPWVTYTHISHTNSGKKDNATPFFALWRLLSGRIPEERNDMRKLYLRRLLVPPWL